MRFKQGKGGAEMPHLDLVPLMDVILSILTFFILASLSLSRQQVVVDVNLPSVATGGSEQKLPDPMVIGLNPQGQTVIENKPVTKEELGQQVKAYLGKNPQGAVVLKADRGLNYEQVLKVLGDMRGIGGDRVSLAIDRG